MRSRQNNSPAVGIDFGTTNSSLARLAGDGVELVRFLTSVTTTESFRSVLYLEQHRHEVASTDGDAPTTRRTTHSWTGPQAIEQYLAAEHKGRLIQSLKSYLPSRLLTGTELFGRHYTLEELIARMLTDLRRSAEEQFGEPVRRAIAGRPVRFAGADKSEDEAYALDRLRKAFELAGFDEVEFELEPVAAAWAYEAALDHDELILIGDFGGGTSDFSLLHVGPTAHQRANRAENLLGNSGVGLAGDAFDARIVRKLVSPALGSDSMARSGSRLLPAVPAWIYANLERWHYLSFLRNRQVMELLRSARTRSLEPEKIESLEMLIDEDLGFQLHQAVQRLKFALSSREAAEFHFREGGFELRIPVTRAEFESWIAAELEQIEQCVDGLMKSSGVDPRAVDRVFLTGGSSFVPAVRRIFESRFGAAKVRSGNEFTSVASGLALRAQQQGR